MQQVEEPELVSAFPAPPVFFSLYTDGADAGPTPPPPLKPTYHSFGTPYSTEDAVPDLLPDDKKVYPKDYNVKDEMKKVNRSLMYSFLELIDVLILNPTKFNAKLDDIEQLFLNMHNLINAYRPHQARETLIDLLKQQIQDRRDASAEIRQIVQNAKDAVQTAHAALDTSLDVKCDDPMDGTTLTTPSSTSSVATPGSSDMTAEEAADLAAATAHNEARQRTQDDQDQFFATCQAIVDAMAVSHSL
ncbi:hypothetical protein H310_09627 [Aphanomyces invadans]|uniref:Mediator of RNA polymerase II transcription subunit 7 n=1 Tax=Aphanomyces invadans TaxID=157072 RepID=A0A024TTC1_9STRA|nr:hypothetical protein H310_09627 [Aphanomyces invadans]ETV97264.1 hypothetical protein H310_09627 [Aphanomyces invadans]|eukprot:XP_008873972.1 hypothetical protein H310_09627 [Aphanomyces invadans]